MCMLFMMLADWQHMFRGKIAAGRSARRLLGNEWWNVCEPNYTTATPFCRMFPVVFAFMFSYVLSVCVVPPFSLYHFVYYVVCWTESRSPTRPSIHPYLSLSDFQVMCLIHNTLNEKITNMSTATYYPRDMIEQWMCDNILCLSDNSWESRLVISVQLTFDDWFFCNKNIMFLECVGTVFFFPELLVLAETYPQCHRNVHIDVRQRMFLIINTVAVSWMLVNTWNNRCYCLFVLCFVTAQTELQTCTSCGEPISDRYFLEVGGCSWHGSCLCCCVCLSPLDRLPSCYLRERQVYCKADYVKWVSAHDLVWKWSIILSMLSAMLLECLWLATL